jgi:plasmid stabilization system protein ParE
MRLELRPRAVNDLKEIRDYLIEHYSEKSAERVRLHLVKRLESLRKRPAQGTASSHPDIRILSPLTYPYRIYFTVTEEAVIILHVRHTSRALPKLEEL